MKVFNPIYDTVFKYLLEDIDIARDLISLIISEEITELVPAPQESSTTNLIIKYSQIPMQRLDYVAIIKTIKNGKPVFEKVMIEVQKSPFKPEIPRFRKYVGEKYGQKSVYKDKDKVKEGYLPLKTIYFVDKEFNNALPSVLQRKGQYYDVLKKTNYSGERDEFVELLNHDSWFIQVSQLPQDIKTGLVYVLSVFAPWMRDIDERYINVEEEKVLKEKHILLSRIVNRLRLAGDDKNVKTGLELEYNYEKYIEDQIHQAVTYKKLASQIAIEKEEALAKEKEALAKEKDALAKEKDALAKEKDALAKVYESVRQMKKFKMPIEAIMQATGLSIDEINSL